MGYWLPHTAGVDWCEPNYALSNYVAEPLNAAAGALPLGFLALHGLQQCSEHKIKLRFSLCYLLMFVVALGTIVFHSSLSWQGQFLYELPTVWATLMFLYAIISLGRDFTKEGIMLGGHAIVTSFVYTQLSFNFFVLTYGFSIICLLICSYRVWRKIPEDEPEEKNCAWLLQVSAALLLVPFFCIVVPEQYLCERLPWLQNIPLHAIYAILDAFGQYYWVVFATLATYHWHPTHVPLLVWKHSILPHVEVVDPKRS